MLDAQHLGYFKWEYTPTFRGFDSFLGYYEGAEDYFTHIRTGSYDMHNDSTPRCGTGCSVTPDLRGQYSVNIFSDEVVRRVHQHSSNTGTGSQDPWFIYAAYQSVHEPLQAPESYAWRYNSTTPGFSSWSKGQKTIAMMLSALDDGIHNVTMALKATGQTANTVIILSADNGGTGSSSNWPLRGGKHSIYEGGCRGASFVNSPLIPTSARGTVNHQLLHAADWLPSLVSLAGGSTGARDSSNMRAHMMSSIFQPCVAANFRLIL